MSYWHASSSFSKIPCYLVSNPFWCSLPLVFVVFVFVFSIMAPKVGRKFKTRANRNNTSSSSGLAFVDRVRFLTYKCEETYETLTKYRSIWGEREIVLSKLDPSIHRNFVSRNWVSLCEVSNPTPTALIREFYSNLSIYPEMTSSHYLTS